MTIFNSLLFLLAATAPQADAIIGNWKCALADGRTIEWNVSKKLNGRWLSGESFINEEPAALDVWTYDESGQLGLRRQFTRETAYLELAPVSFDGVTLVLEGIADSGGDPTKIAETIKFLSDDEFEAQWSGYDVTTEKWNHAPWEICRKSSAASEED